MNKNVGLMAYPDAIAGLLLETGGIWSSGVVGTRTGEYMSGRKESLLCF